ncbi:MAG TPA: biopolymer transporter ExbD [Limnobacter sp.]|nr:biopolymer transporter ExbD [Limnobacter sp.]
MKIRRTQAGPEAPDINLIPLIDVLLVIVIFLVVSTTFLKPSALAVDLPGTSQAKAQPDQSQTLRIRVGKDGNYGFGHQATLDARQLRSELTKALASNTDKPEDRRAIVEADASATHQSVVTVMDLLAGLGVARVSIATAANPR